MKSKAISYFVETAFIGVGAVVTKFVEQLGWLGFVLIGIGVTGIIVTIFWGNVLRPVKLKVSELAYWYIERPEPEHHGWPHCHEYNFAGEIAIIPRAKESVEAFYLELPVGNEVIEVRLSSPLALPFDITPSEKITRHFAFQKRLERKVKIPSFAYMIMKFKHSKSKKLKVNLIADADYRFKHSLGEHTE